MTSLAGVWDFGGNPSAAERCSRMLAAEEAYAPQPPAQWSDGGVALGRRLVRLVPEDAFDRQPLIGGNGRFVLVADLRLDNREELASELRIPAERLRELSDAAILLAAFERWGENSVDRLLGDFAFALWDAERAQLVLARDHVGTRPLHYHRGNDFFAFASMPKGLHALAEIPYGPDERSITEFLALMPEEGSRTFFRGIERVQPGHVAIVRKGSVDERRYWQPRRRTLRYRRSEDYAEAMREQLERAVKARLRGVHDVAAHLSAGLDSSAVAATAARLLAPSGGKVVAFTAVPREGFNLPGLRGAIADEGPYAAATAALYPNMEHVLVRTPGRSAFDGLDRIFNYCERPLLNIENFVWSTRIYELAKERKLNVLLNGGLGNAGLSYHGSELLAELFGSGRWLRFYRAAKEQMKAHKTNWRGIAMMGLGPWCPDWLLHLVFRMRGKTAENATGYAAVNPMRFPELGLDARARAAIHDPFGRSGRDSFALRMFMLQRVDVGTYYRGVLGSWGIDERDPTSDRRLLEFCLSVPTEQYQLGGVSRSLARRALADRVPKLVIEERRRGYQAADWFEDVSSQRDRVTQELERLENCPPAARAIDLPRLRKLVDDWPESGWEREEIHLSYGTMLMRALSIGHFLRRTTGSNA